ncbi:23S rRNA (uracil(1939)-C(5))-methyltransferase RlmD [Pseudoalteromonas sp. MMG010]|uniref:23S rRNA (uracil(1939)-C(5))-methyltransferase RlmD n=1 Tax=Pseudoalteromonas sp. MMG010 TaxID=2822685 RepID=UPI001B3A6FBE|nr:23S rRNA (uracil(1939)-C(5))-methyltransferase RlmD [Pseudoalteromonas sp. MMG010]MBQ4831921.1 23S rRNA (uracil(1939)-C(5))-methyltransferase RlmD [Pseudoalteromonas sp. MMG010]
MAQIFKAVKKTHKPKAVELTITAMDHQGRGIAKYNNKVCFVSGALPNEYVKATITQEKSRYSEAFTTKVIKPSEYRSAAICEHYKQCGGCQLQHLDVAQQVIEKQQAVAQLFSKFANLPNLNWQAPLHSESTHYRRSARIAVMYDKASKKIRVGYRASGSKNVISIEHCPVLSKAFTGVFTLFEILINQHKQLQSISHLQLCEADNARYIVIRHTKAINNEAKQLIEQAVAPYHWQLVFQDKPEVIDSDHIMQPHYELEGLRFAFGLNNFIQVNAQINQTMIKQAIDWLALNPENKVLDLFCGIGNFSLVLAKHAKHVIGVEGVASAVAMATQNAHTNKITNSEFHCFDLTQKIEQASWFSHDLDVLVLDPSRTGAMAILAQLELTQFNTILYVSCDPVTLARDSAIISQAGFTLNKIGLMNMFPHTGHIETMAIFHKR